MRRPLPLVSALAVACGVATGAAPTGGLAAPVAPPPPVTVEVSDHGYTMPGRVAGGVVTMRFRNVGLRVHEFALGRVDPGHTVADARRALDSGGRRPWLHDVGGPGVMTPGAEITVTRTLAPGTYFFADGVPDTRGVPFLQRGGWKAFTVAGDSGATLPHADAVVVAERNRFVVPRLTGGVLTLELRNRSGAGRGFMLASVAPGHTRAEAERWFATIEKTGRQPSSAPPATLLGVMQTIPSGTSVFVTVRLEAGRRYELSDDESGARSAFTPRG